MSEARRKKERRAAFLERHPLCCYCGGATPATTIDHVPSRQMFTGRRRPKGLEVPACASCNGATRLDEQVAAMLGRFYPDATTAEEQQEVHEIFRAIGNNNPGLFEELQPSQRQVQRLASATNDLPRGVGGALNCQGPLLNRSIALFGGKLGFALHYVVAGRIVANDGGIAVKWYTNFDRITGRIPGELFRILGSPETLRQGRWHVSNQFEYAYAVAETGRMAAYFSTFRQSFAVLSWVSEDAADLDGANPADICRPGFRFESSPKVTENIDG